jgi:hypothetical protein
MEFRTLVGNLMHSVTWCAQHDRILHNIQVPPVFLIVWDPITDEKRELPLPAHMYKNCQAYGTPTRCNHLDCHSGGPFLVVFSSIIGHAAYFTVFSLEIAPWSKLSGIYLDIMSRDIVGPSLLIGVRLHIAIGHEILNLSRHRPSLMNSLFTNLQNMNLETTEDSGLGVTIAQG